MGGAAPRKGAGVAWEGLGSVMGRTTALYAMRQRSVRDGLNRGQSTVLHGYRVFVYIPHTSTTGRTPMGHLRDPLVQDAGYGRHLQWSALQSRAEDVPGGNLAGRRAQAQHDRFRGAARRPQVAAGKPAREARARPKGAARDQNQRPISDLLHLDR